MNHKNGLLRKCMLQLYTQLKKENNFHVLNTATRNIIILLSKK